MKKIISLLTYSALAASFINLSFINAGFASDAIGPGDSESKWILGGSAISMANIYAGEGDSVELTPNIVFNGERE